MEEICRELGVCIIVLHHARKNGIFSAHSSCAEQMLGATSIAGAASACILINKRANDHTFRMDSPRYGEAIEGELVLRLDAQGWVSARETYKKKWVNQTKLNLMEAAQHVRKDDLGWFTAADLSGMGIQDPETGAAPKRSSLYWALNALVKDNLLEDREATPAECKGKRGKPERRYRVLMMSGVTGADA
jgi:hypothetical protein